MQFIAAACAAELKVGSLNAIVRHICTDSRLAKAGDLFLAIAGDKFDGHDFIQEVAARGVTAVMVDRRKIPATLPGCAVLAVDDVRAAYGKIAAVYRREFNLPLVVVGGSNGKTTTKELLASVLRQKFATLWSEASFNNDIGVPATLLRLEKTHTAAVLETGTNHPGELAPLVRMCGPQLGVITNVGREHLEFFGDLAGVAQEEGALAEELSAESVLFVNGDNAWTEQLVRRTKARVVRVGLGATNDWRAKGVRLDKQGVKFQVETARSEYGGEYRVNLLGRHQVINALLAAAVGQQLGLDRAAILRGLAECAPAKMRLQFWEANGVRVLDDCYNANADSVLAALDTLCGLPLQGRRVAVLGDMGELGAQAEAAHAEVGRRVAELGINQLIAVGRMAPVMAAAARAAGMARVFEFAEVPLAMNAVKNFVKPGDVVLLKASRAAHLERIADLLKLEKK